MSARRSTGMPAIDAQHDFLRVRRIAIIVRLFAWVSRLLARLLRRPGLAWSIELLRYDEVVRELGFLAERRLGSRVVRFDDIVGTVDRGGQFDRRFRPGSARQRQRWERIAAAMRRGDPLPPVDLLAINGLYFVQDGHHRISVARALGYRDIDANVTEVLTARLPRENTQLFNAT
jgi:hypothetical protein